jgi:uncharacterized membrane protein HdeD (DUF308 family)
MSNHDGLISSTSPRLADTVSHVFSGVAAGVAGLVMVVSSAVNNQILILLLGMVILFGGIVIGLRFFAMNRKVDGEEELSGGGWQLPFYPTMH